MLLLQASSISNGLFYDIPVHKWLTAEEIDLKIYTVTGIGNEEIQRFLCYVKWASDLCHPCTLLLLQNNIGRQGYNHVQY